MGTLNEDLTGIKAIEDKLTANKVANFAYTDQAYADPLNEADGVEYYDVDAEQNIPLPDPSIMNVNETVLTKGFRSQASSIPRMLLNHFFGRVSYNLNKLNDNMSSLLATLMNHLGSANGIAPLNANGLLDINKGGTNASTVEGARTNLDINNVINTSDSAVPVSGGTTKFTTGGAYTELNKKQNKTLDTPLTVEGFSATTVETALAYLNSDKAGAGKTLNTYDSTIIKVSGLNKQNMTFVLRQRGSETIFLSIGANLQDTSSNVNYRALRYSTVTNNKITNLKFDYSNMELYLTSGSYGRFSIMQIDGEKADISLTAVNSVPTENVFDIPVSDIITSDEFASIAPVFSASTAYAVGDYVIYNGDLYRCTVAHSAGAWNNSYFTAVTVGGDLETKANQTDLAVPSDAVLHYSFDDVPDLPDGNAVYRKNNDFTTTNDWETNGNFNTLSIVNNCLRVQSLGTWNNSSIWSTYLESNSFANKLVKIRFRTSSVANVFTQDRGGDYTNHYLSYKPLGGNLYEICVLTESSYTYNQALIIQYANVSTDNYFIIEQFYIGDGSYVTPIIDNANGQWNSISASGVAVKGVSGKGLKLYANEVDCGGFNFNDNFTISLWINPDNNKTGLEGTLIAKGYCLYLRNGSVANNKILLGIYNPSTSGYINYTNIADSLATGQNHIVLIKSETNVYMYVNGVKINVTSSAPANMAQNSRKLYIGSTSNTRPQSIDDLLIFDRALSADEVQALYLNKANTPKFYDINNYNIDKATPIPEQNSNKLFTTGGAFDFFGGNTKASSWLGKVFGWALGRNWTASLMTSGTFYTVYHANGIWVACSAGGNIGHGLWWSTDGKAWTAGTGSMSDDTFLTVYYANGIWVACNSGHGLWWSTDGKAWTAGTGSMTGYVFNTVYYADGLWVAGTTGHGLWWSTDGKAWTAGTGSMTSYGFATVYHVNGLWVAGSAGHGLWWSTDGKAWTVGTGSMTSYTFYTVYHANGIWVAGSAGHSGCGLWWSTDGVTWTQGTSSRSGYIIFNKVYYANGIWVACSTDYGLFWSTDGKAWTQGTGAITDYAFSRVYYANGVWVACSVDYGLWWSTDGKAWLQGAGSMAGYIFNTVYYANGTWVAGSTRHGLWHSDYSNAELQ